MNLPESLITYRTKNILKRLVLCLALLAAITALAFYYRETIFSYELIPPFAIACIGIAVYSVPFAVSGFPAILFDSNWEGVITGIDIKTNMATYVNGGKPGGYYKNDIILTIQKQNGKTVKHTAKSLGVKERVGISATILGSVHNVATGKIENHVDEFSVGDKVYHFYGFKYNFYVHEPCSEHRHCIVCGTANNFHSKTCWSCHNELVKHRLTHNPQK